MNAPAPPTRHFTVDEANRTLPLVRMIVRDIVELHADVQRRRERMRALRDRARDHDTREVREMEQDLDADLARLQELVEELAEIGAELKDPETGAVHFPTIIDDRDACLCWEVGEESITFWHDLQSGASGRQPLPSQSE
jgi:hypothetical protein